MAEGVLAVEPLLCRTCLALGSSRLLAAIVAANGGQVPEPARPPRASVRGAVRHVAALCGMDPGVLLAGGRRRAVVRWRQAAMWVARQASGQSWTEIGRVLGRDHSTMIYGAQRAEAEMRLDREYAWTLERAWASAEAEPWGPGESGPKPIDLPPPAPERAAEPAEPEPPVPAVPAVRTVPGEYVPRHALPPVMAVVDAELEKLAAAERGKVPWPGMVEGSQRLLEALCREFPGRCLPAARVAGGPC